MGLIIFILIYYVIGWYFTAVNSNHPQSAGLWDLLVWPKYLI